MLLNEIILKLICIPQNNYALVILTGFAYDVHCYSMPEQRVRY